MTEVLARNADAKVGVEQLAFAKPWLPPARPWPCARRWRDEVQAVLSGRKQPKKRSLAQKAADEILDALRRANLAPAAAVLIGEARRLPVPPPHRASGCDRPSHVATAAVFAGSVKLRCEKEDQQEGHVVVRK